MSDPGAVELDRYTVVDNCGTVIPGRGSLLTRRWSKRDSNSRSQSARTAHGDASRSGSLASNSFQNVKLLKRGHSIIEG
jgi:hypothetical protein